MANFIIANRIARGLNGPSRRSFGAIGAATESVTPIHIGEKGPDRMNAVAESLKKFATILADSHQSPRPAKSIRGLAAVTEGVPTMKEAPKSRRLLRIQCESRDLDEKRSEWGQDIIAELEVPRSHGEPYPMAQLLAQRDFLSTHPGTLQPFRVVVRCGGKPVVKARVTVTFYPITGAQILPTAAVTNARGEVHLDYDSSKFRPGVLLVVPRDGAWSWMQHNPTDGMEIHLPTLEKGGPLGWWHQILGVRLYDTTRGQKIRIGVADTGVGPHPYLSHVRQIGAYIGGTWLLDGGQDVENHGTHVCGILGARPEADSGDYGGLAPGAEIYCARVFSDADPASPTSTPATTNGDVARAIDALALEHQVDLLNLSLGGADYSEIERDAISAALEAGTLTLAAAGNSYGQPVMYPAAYPEAVAISAIGIAEAAPPGTLDADAASNSTIPGTSNGLVYLANFSNIGPALKCAGPGVGIISTVPATNGNRPYAAMSGTSMATPAVCAALASLLGQDHEYESLPRGLARSARAYTVLMQSLRPLRGIAANLVGGGLASATWPV